MISNNMNSLYNAKKISSSGMEAQSIRLRVVSENIANASTSAQTPNSDPYRRKLAVFENKDGYVKVKQIKEDQSPFKQEYRPSDPGANAQGMVKLANVNPLIELMDLKQADQSFYACLKAYEVANDLDRKITDILRG